MLPSRCVRMLLLAGCWLCVSAALHRTPAVAADWPQWGGTDDRNMVSPEKGLPESFEPGKKRTDGSGIDRATT
jgi:hypothetical protein